MKAIVAVASTIALASTPTTTTSSTTTAVIRRDTPSEDSSPNMKSSISGWSVQDDEYDGDDDNDGDNGNDDEYDGDDHEEEEHFAYTPLPCLHRIEVSYSTVPIPYHHTSSQPSYQSILHPSRTPVMSLLLEALQTDRVDCQLLLSAFELDEDL
jgi:hypothetical protein